MVCLPKLVSIKLSPIHESLGFFGLRALAELNVGKPSGQVDSLVHGKLNMLHGAILTKDFMDALCLHIPGQMAHMQPAGLCLRGCVLLQSFF